MKKVITLLILFLSIVSCSSSDDNAAAAGTGIIIDAKDFFTEINENPEKGLSLGTIEASVNQGELSFAIDKQSPEGALELNESTGELQVINETLFDYELHPELTATANISSGGTTETIDITVSLKNLNNCFISKISTGTKSNLIEERFYDDQNRISIVKKYVNEGSTLVTTHTYTYETDKITVKNLEHRRNYEWDSKYTLKDGLAIEMEELKIPDLRLEYDRTQTWEYDENNFIITDNTVDQRYAGNITATGFNYIIEDENLSKSVVIAVVNTNSTTITSEYAYDSSLENKQNYGTPFLGRAYKNLVTKQERTTKDMDDNITDQRTLEYSYVLNNEGYIVEEKVGDTTIYYEYFCIEE
ncbi:hypothetical protein [Aquimarina mytili]|uniref:Cadherin domain-containing protein n=1 Tax=Aquimarina mytili TaxID=874423 RepID=A0A937D663_9FLAO|nr:hypothetical protein [Aquimarina mytili]MBL0684039.1 hypothetical protein [Aquimarina mytili]